MTRSCPFSSPTSSFSDSAISPLRGHTSTSSDREIDAQQSSSVELSMQGNDLSSAHADSGIFSPQHQPSMDLGSPIPQNSESDASMNRSPVRHLLSTDVSSLPAPEQLMFGSLIRRNQLRWQGMLADARSPRARASPRTRARAKERTMQMVGVPERARIGRESPGPLENKLALLRLLMSLMTRSLWLCENG